MAGFMGFRGGSIDDWERGPMDRRTCMGAVGQLSHLASYAEIAQRFAKPH